MGDIGVPLTLLSLTVAYIVSVAVCFSKGKLVFGWLGIVGFMPPFAPILIWFPIVGALRLAKPESSWSQKRYDDAEMEQAHRRFTTISEQPKSQPSTPHTDRAVAPPPGSETLDEIQLAVITRFLARARDADILDPTTHQRLADFSASRQQAGPPQSLQAETAEIALTTEPVAETTWGRSGAQGKLESSARPATSEQADLGPTAAETPIQPAPLSRTPPQDHQPPLPQPSPIATWLSDAWDAIAVDVAIHGFSYLGVLTTVVGVLGFLLFAFADLPDATQPFVELFIASVFFGWSWALRRQGAIRVGEGMELVGGIVLPLVVFAGLVDDAPIPPDFKGGLLIAALVASALVLAAMYGLVSARYPGSVLRYLVGPLVWLAAMSLGFMFKSDEPLRSDAITRLVSPQPAMAAAGIAITLLACRRWSSHRLASPTVTASLVGLPITYLLTVSLAAGERWENTSPLVLLGVATFASAELTSRWFERNTWLPIARPLLLAGVLLPLAPAIEAGWLGLFALVAYLGLLEPIFRSEPFDRVALSLTAAGAAVSALMTLAEPQAALAGFSLLTVWAPFQRNRNQHSDRVEQNLIAVGATAPIGVVWALIQLVGGAPGWLITAVLVGGIAGWARWRDQQTPMWAYWPSGASLIAACGSIITWNNAGRTDLFAASTLVVAAIIVWAGPTLVTPRMWIGSLMAIGAGATAMETQAVAVSDQAVTWAVLGVTTVLASIVLKSPLAGHAAAVGHLIGFGALLHPAVGVRRASVWILWTAGWVVSTVASERERESVATLLDRAVARFERADRPEWLAKLVPPVLMVASLPPAVIVSLNLWDGFRERRWWTGIVMAGVALVYASTLRVARGRALSIVLTGAAMVSSLIGVAVSAPDPWSSVVSVSSVIAVALLLSREHRSIWFVWVAWVMTFPLVLLLGDRAGVEAGSLHVLSLVWGAVLMFGGLALDDSRSGRRLPGEGLRISWLRQPVILGALAVPVSLGPVYLDPPQVHGWWSLGAAVAYLMIAWLMRVGAASSVGYILAAMAAASLAPWPILDHPWTFVVLAGTLVLASWLTARIGGASGDPWLRWDVAPLVVAHAVGGFALVYAAARGGLAAAALAFGFLSLAVAGWRRSWWWADVANGLVVVAAFDIDGVWPAVALAVTAVRGAAIGLLTSGARRVSNHTVGAVSAGLCWVTFLSWLEPSVGSAVGASAVVWGGYVAAVAAVWRTRRPRLDTAWLWGGVGVLAMILLTLAAADAGRDGVEGVWLGFGYLLVVGALEVVRPMLTPLFQLVALPLTAMAWGAMLVGLDISRALTVDLTAVVFGVLVAGVVELRRLAARRTSAAESSLLTDRKWFGLGVVGVVTAAAAVDVAEASRLWVALGLALVAVGSARGAGPLSVGWLRDVAGVAGLTAFSLASAIAEWSVSVRAITIVVLGASATVIAFWLRGRSTAVAWMRPLAVFSGAANLIASIFAIGALPDRSLLVAVLLSLGTQTWAFGQVFGRDGVSAWGPPLIGLGFVLAIEQSASGSVQWYTIPLGLVVIAEVEVVRRWHPSQSARADPPAVVVTEGIGLGLIAVPALVEMFTNHITFGLVAYAGAGLTLLWGILSRLRRRVVAAAAIATSSAVLMIFAAAAGGAPASAFWWIVAIGVGFALMLVAALVEAYRSGRGRVMARLDDLMEGWQ